MRAGLFRSGFCYFITLLIEQVFLRGKAMLKWIGGIAALAVVAIGAFVLLREDHDDHAHHDEHDELEVIEHGDLEIIDVFYLPSAGTAPTAAAFMIIENDGSESDRLIEAKADISRLVELHTHIQEDGLMKMRPIEGGLEIPAGGEAHLERGGDHVMFMGLTTPLEEGDEFDLTLVFEKAGEITFEVHVGEAGHEGHDH